MSKKPKLKPVIIVSRDGMRAVAAKLVADKLELKRLQVKVEKKKAEIEKENQEEIDELTRDILTAEAGLQVWSAQHKDGPEFAGKKSIELPSATFGFRTGPHKCEKEGKETWDQKAALLASVRITGKDAEGNDVVLFNGEDYIRYGSPSVDKDAILRDRKSIPAEALAAVGIRIDQDEFFYFEPKSEVLEATSQEAA